MHTTRRQIAEVHRVNTRALPFQPTQAPDARIIIASAPPSGTADAPSPRAARGSLRLYCTVIDQTPTNRCRSTFAGGRAVGHCSRPATARIQDCSNSARQPSDVVLGRQHSARHVCTAQIHIGLLGEDQPMPCLVKGENHNGPHWVDCATRRAHEIIRVCMCMHVRLSTFSSSQQYFWKRSDLCHVTLRRHVPRKAKVQYLSAL